MEIDPRLIALGRLPDFAGMQDRAMQRSMSLAEMSDRQLLRKMEMEQQQRAVQERQALEQVLPELAAGNFSPEAEQRAVRAQPMAGQSVFKLADARRKAQAEYEAKQADTLNKRTEAQMRVADKLANEAQWLAEHPDIDDPSIGPKMIGKFQQKIADAGLEKILTTVPFQDWTNPAAARRGLAAAGSMFYDIKDRVAQQQTAKRDTSTAEHQAAQRAETERQHRAQIGMEGARLAQSERHFERRLGTESLGQPQEVSIDGKPGLASFNRRGGWVDPGTGQPITGTVAPKTPDLSAAVREKVATNNTLLYKVDDALAGVEARPQSVGYKFGISDAADQRLDPEGVDVRAAIASIGSQKIHDLSGANVTMSEAPRLQPFIPSVRDTPAAVRTKLRRLRQETETLQRELMAGRSVMDAVNMDAVKGPTLPPGIRAVRPVD